MITIELLKEEIEKVKDEYLELLYKIIKAFETTTQAEVKRITKNDIELGWHEFIKATYGCLSDDPIERGNQGKYEIREEIE